MHPLDLPLLAEDALGILGWTPGEFASSTAHEVRLGMAGWHRAQEVETERASIAASWIINGSYTSFAKAQAGKRYKPVKPTDLYKRPVPEVEQKARAEAVRRSVTKQDRDWLRSGPATRPVAAFRGGPGLGAGQNPNRRHTEPQGPSQG